jgi:hypothetical protein
LNPAEEIEKAVTYQNIRLLQVKDHVSDVELEEVGVFSVPWSAPTVRKNTTYTSLIHLNFYLNTLKNKT